jgi:hypothetical protein
MSVGGSCRNSKKEIASICGCEPSAGLLREAHPFLEATGEVLAVNPLIVFADRVQLFADPRQQNEDLV